MASGQVSKSGQILNFEGVEFGPYYVAYLEGMEGVLKHEDQDLAQAFQDRLLLLHTQGM